MSVNPDEKDVAQSTATGQVPQAGESQAASNNNSTNNGVASTQLPLSYPARVASRKAAHLPTPGGVARQRSTPTAAPFDFGAAGFSLETLGGDSSLLLPTPSAPNHRRVRSQNETSYAILTSETADQLQASWSNVSANPDDPLNFSASAAGFSSFSSNLGLDSAGRPLPISRLSSTASSMSGSVPQGIGGAGVGGGSDDPNTYNINGVSSIIHDAARIMNWGSVKQLCQEMPEAAKYVGKDRWTALHHACSRRCKEADVVEALIRAYPEALTLEEEKGWYPLHYGCRFKAPKDVIRLLLHMYPDEGQKAVEKLDRQGRSPLYYAVRYDAPHGVTGLLLEVNASAVLEEDQNADSPMGLVWDAWAEKLDGKKTLQSLYGSSKSKEMTASEMAAYVSKRLHCQTKAFERWQKANQFLMAAFGFAGDGDEITCGAAAGNDGTTTSAGAGKERKRVWRILHAVAAINCHPSLFQLACTLHPEQAFEIDDFDLMGPKNMHGGWQLSSQQSALHLAASSRANGETGKAIMKQLLAVNPNLSQVKDKDGGLPLHRIVENKAKTNWASDGIVDIYQAYEPAIRSVDADGRLPLHRAATSIVPQGDATNESTMESSIMCNLLNLSPDASSQADTYGRLPLHFAVEHCGAWDCQLQMLYDAYPQAIRVRTGVKLGNGLPLHIAAASLKAEASLIEKLVSYHPRATSQADRHGKLPLHYACESGRSWDAVRIIHESNDNAISQVEQNDRRWNCLQLASSAKGADSELLIKLLELDRAAAASVDESGRLALHLAAMYGKTWDGGLRAIFDANPDAVRTPDKKGLLPFHYACIRYAGTVEEAVELKPATNPRPAQKKHHRRVSSRVSMEALQRAQAREAEAATKVDILFNLLKADPTVL